MKRIFSWAIKIIPLITIWQGVTSGGARLGPVMDTIKVALTQYEVIEITKLVYKEFEIGEPLKAEKFPEFIQENFHNQYSILARELSGDKSHDLSRDIWGLPYQLIMNQDITHIKIASGGPDHKISSKDDIGVDFTIDRPAPAPRVAKQREPVNQEEAPSLQEDSEASHQENSGRGYASDEFDEYGFDRDGFDQDGFDRDGYDRNGMHRSEKAITHEEY